MTFAIVLRNPALKNSRNHVIKNYVEAKTISRCDNPLTGLLKEIRYIKLKGFTFAAMQCQLKMQ